MELLFFSGYIRNAVRLSEELGIPSQADRKALEKEILFQGFRKWGEELCAHLYGAFSFVIADGQALYCARDQLGIIPFFYHLTDSGRLLYSDDIRAIASDERYHRTLDERSLRTFLMLGYCTGDHTLFAGIQKLPAGHWLIFTEGTLTLRRYYVPTYTADHARSEKEWMTAIEQTALEILSEDRTHPQFEHAESFLSGGVDSSYLLALSGIKNACGIGYAEEAFSESHLAQQTADILGRSFREKRISAEEYFRAVPNAVATLGMPLADASSVVFNMGCADVSSRSPLCFSGEGADEFFAGYWLYHRADELAQNGGPLHLGCSGVMSQQVMENLLLSKDPDFSCESLVRDIYEATENCEHLSRLLAIDIGLWLESDILFSLSRASAAYGLEVRTPFADRRMFELAAQIPSSLKLRDGVGKYILRKAAEKRLPQEVAFRKKVGFSVPVRLWMRMDGIRDQIEAVLFNEASQTLFHQPLLHRMWENYLNGNDVLWQIIYAAYVLLIWYKQWF